MAIESLSAESMIVSPVWTILSKGKTGTGKTILSCGKEFRPTYVFNLDGRFESVVNYYKRLDGHTKDLHYNNFTLDTGQFHAMDEKMDAIVARPEYKTVVIASLTSYIDIVLFNLMGATIPQQRRVKGGIQVPILEDYNFEDSAIINELIRFVQVLKNQGTNVILEAHVTPYEETTIEDKQRVTKTINQILTKGKKAPAKIPTYFNEVWYFEKVHEGWGKPAKYTVNTIGDSANECKTSFGIEPFDFTKTDPTIKLINLLGQDIKDNPRTDPNAPKMTAW